MLRSNLLLATCLMGQTAGLVSTTRVEPAVRAVRLSRASRPVCAGRPVATRPHLTRAGRPVAQYGSGGQFDVSTEQFDVLSLRSFRRDALLQYDATNQSEPLRIALCLLGVLFALTYPSLLSETPGLAAPDPLVTNVGSAVGAIGFGALFQRNRVARAARIERISREYALGDLRATYRAVRTVPLRELRGKLRVVILVGTQQANATTLREAHAYRRRLAAVSPSWQSLDGWIDR